MAFRIAYCTHKGGVGKTSISTQHAYMFAKAGLRVMVVDFDPQGNMSSRIFDGEYNGTNLPDLFKSELEPITPVDCKEGVKGILVPIDREKQNLVDEVVNLTRVDEEHLLNPALQLQQVDDDYDIILFDTPPSIGNLLVAALLAATHVVIPVEPAGFSQDGVSQIFDTLGRVQEVGNNDLEVAGFLINRYNRRVRFHRDAVAEITEKVPHLVFKSTIGILSRVDMANSEGLPLSAFKDGAGRSAQKQIRDTARELLNRIGAKKLSAKLGGKA